MTAPRRLIFGLGILLILLGCHREQQPTSQPQAQARQASDGQSVKPATYRKVREAAVAGLFYPKHETELAKAVDELLAKAKAAPVGKLRGLVAPHAGYEYSGPIAATAYKLLRERQFETVVVMAPSHYAEFEGAAIPDVEAFATPLGQIPLSSRAAELAKVRPFCVARPCEMERPRWWQKAAMQIPPFGEDTPHTWEHSLEVQLPFLQRTVKEFSLVPVVFGHVDPEAVARGLAGSVDAKTLLVASSDLSHYLPYEKARGLDTACVDAVCRLDIEGMGRQDACGKGPILTLMHVAKQKGWKTKLLDYRNSGDTAGDRSAVVGYAAIAFFTEEPAGASEASDAGCTPAERKLLVEMARESLVESVHGRGAPKAEVQKLPEKFRARGACFVTLTKDGQLRGCIGHIFPQRPLYQAVSENARNAALEDPRFPPVKPEELDRIRIEISLLTLPKPLEFKTPEELMERLRPGVDGVVLHVGRRQSTYLPQVWEQIPDKESFLNHLAEKAGLAASAWRDPAAKVLTYQVEAFHEDQLRRDIP